MAENSGSFDLEQLGESALRFVKPGCTIGLGTGRAATAFIRKLGASGLNVSGVPTSEVSANLARELGINVLSLAQADKIEVTIDGADEVDPRLNLIKGYGGALVREKIVAAASRKRVILVGADKLVKKLGQRGRLPVEVLPFAAPFCARKIKSLGLKPTVRKRDDGSDYITDNGNLILDCGLQPILSARKLEAELLAIPGVVGTGLFVAMADVVLVAEAGGKIRTLKRLK